ncbi:MAG: B12-binding domain-containing protein [Candidatus Sericytochromatia bacterium]
MVTIELLDPYLDAVLAGDRHRAQALVEEALNAGMPMRRLYLDVFQAAQYRIGDLWAENRITVGMEHRATAITQALIASLYERIIPEDGHGRPVVIAAPGCERHELGPRMVADFAEMAGYDVTYLGPCVEPEALIRAVREHRPVAVGLSIALAPHMREVERLIGALREALGPACPPLFVGGRAFSGDPEAWRRIGADAYSRDAEGAVALLDQQSVPG